MGMQYSRGLVAGYPFENTGLDITGTYNGTVSGMVYDNGLFGRAGKFDGVDDCFKCGQFLGGTVLTAACWVKLNAAGSYGIITKLPNTSDRGNWSLRTTSGVLELAYISPANTVNTISTSVNLGTTWNHIAFTLDGTTIRIYINTVLVKTQALTLFTSNADIYIGCQEISIARRFLNGIVDSAVFFNRALNVNEIKQLHLNLGI
jgi:hypothetical protein